MDARRLDVPCVRLFRPTDEPAVHAILLAVLDAGELTGTTRRDLERDAFRMIAAEHDAVFVSLWGDTLTGVFLTPWPLLAVHPAHRRRGHGRRLVEAAMERARQRSDAVMELAPPRGSDAAAAFAVALGFHYRYSIWQMRLDNALAIPPAAFPSDVRTRPYALGADDEAFVELFNIAFARHEPSMSVTLEAIRTAHGGPEFDPASLAIVTLLETETPVAFCRTFVDVDDGVRVGEVRVLGVHPDWRGRGLGRELLRWAVHHLRESGVDDVRLAVGGRNDSALRLYERTGFTRHQEWPRWVRATDAHASSDADSNL